MDFNQILFKSQILIISLSTFLLLPLLNGQQIEKVDKKKYQYEGQIYKYGEMDHVFKQNKFSYIEYQKTIRKRKTAKTLGYVSLGGLALGLAMTPLYLDDCLFTQGGCTAGIIGGMSLLLFPIAGIAAVIVHSGSKKLERTSVDIFNQQAPDINNGTSTSLNAQLGLLSNGRVGIVFNF